MSCNYIQTLNLSFGNDIIADPQFARVKSLIHFDGAHGSSVFSDVKGNPLYIEGVTVDRNNAIIAPNSGYFAGPGASSRQAVVVTTGSNGDGVEDYTVEFYCSMQELLNAILIDSRPGMNGNYVALAYNRDILLLLRGSGVAVTGAVNIAPNQTYHIALSHKNGVTRCFLNGKVVFTYAASVNLIDRFQIGSNPFGGGDRFKGWIGEFRYTSGLARYEQEFAPAFERFPSN